MKTALWWIRRDLRLGDNQALTAALSRADQVLPVFVLDPELLKSPYVGKKRLAFLYEGLNVLDRDLHQRGSYLVIRRGNPIHILSDLCRRLEAVAIFAEADHSPYAHRRDRRVTKSLPLHLVEGLTTYSPREILKPDGMPYKVYAPFNRAWQDLPWPGGPLPTPLHIPTPAGLESERVPDNQRDSINHPFPAGESEAQRRLRYFIDGQDAQIFNYQENRNRLDLQGTSRLSPYLRFGMLSARQAVAAARQAATRAWGQTSRRGVETWLNEIIWREFYLYILYHFPQVRTASYRPEMDRIGWMNQKSEFEAWKEGQTGYPIVDAAMRQLLEMGWNPNRTRMILASFLTKDLLIDWRWGERHFMQHLIDGDPAANNGGWQWIAGSGADASPYFRIFNPVLQSRKFDPNGVYIRHFLPELAGVPDKYIHEPWKLPPYLQRNLGCVIGKDYPAPIVDHAFARKRALSAYRGKV
jgi:deoxyribodipyrimidine photo-lyase